MNQTHLILIPDGKLALAVGAALQDRLQADGHDALAFVPSLRGGDAGSGSYLHQAGLWRESAPQVVALYEDGLLERLKSLGLAAYVGVPADQDWRVIHWDDQAGAMLLPVVTARDLVDAVADYTPWPAHAAAGPSVPRLRRPAARPAGRGKTSAASRGGIAAAALLSGRLFPAPGLSRKIAAATVAGPILLVGLPAAAAAAASAPAQHAFAQASGSSGTPVHGFAGAGTQRGPNSAAADGVIAGWLTGLLQDPLAGAASSSTTGAGASDLRSQIPVLARLTGGTATGTVPASVLPWLGTVLGLGTHSQNGTGAAAPAVTPAAPAKPAAPVAARPALQPAAPGRPATTPAPATRPAPAGGGGGGGGGIPVHPFTSSATPNPPPHATPIPVLSNPAPARPPQLRSGSRSSSAQNPSQDPLDGAPLDPADPDNPGGQRIITASNDQSPGDSPDGNAPAGGGSESGSPGDNGSGDSGNDAAPPSGPVMLASGGLTMNDASPGGIAGLGQEPTDTAPATPAAPAATPPATGGLADPGLLNPGPIDTGLTGGIGGADPGLFDPAPTATGPIGTSGTGGTTAIGAPIVSPSIEPVDPGDGVSIGIGEIPGTGDSVFGPGDGSGIGGGGLLGDGGGLGSPGGGLTGGFSDGGD